MKVAVVGTGYVGLVAGACLADTGNRVWCIDSDGSKVAALSEGRVPIYEEGLADVVTRGMREHRLRFTTDAHRAIRESEIVFVAVGTPPTASGAADLSQVFEAARTVAAAARHPTLLVLKSTVPVGTNQRITGLLKELGARAVEVVSNPEFLKEGAAINDFRHPDRVVLGVRSERAAETMRALYAPFVRTGAPVLVMDPASAELTKYAANAMLATRISFMNAIAGLCERVGANVESVRHGVGADKRIGPTFLFAGIGYGGSCFPKDVQALLATARSLSEPLELLEAVERVNARQKSLLLTKLERAFAPLGGLGGRTVALWGLSFKPNTDDVRESPALTMLHGLLDRGVRVCAHDPVACARAADLCGERLEGGRLRFVDDAYEATSGADALVVATEWGEYRRPDFDRLRKTLRRPWIFDGRNLWEPPAMAARGFVYRSVGRPDAQPVERVP